MQISELDLLTYKGDESIYKYHPKLPDKVIYSHQYASV